VPGVFENNRVTKLLGIEYPIIQGGMAWVANARLAAAVSSGGGLGVIAAASMPPELLEKEIMLARELTDKPFGVNIMLMSETADDAIEIAAEMKVPVVTTGAGMPGKVFERLKPLGTIVIPVIASAAHAVRVAKRGADAVIAEGHEAGGHVGEITTMTLVPQVVEAVDVPVIAAGGIATGRGMAAAFALGAEGVQVGTRFVCASESTVHMNYKNAILRANDRSTVITGRPTGHPVRVLKNKLAKKYEELERTDIPLSELEKLGAGALRLAVVDGDVDFGSLMAGQSAGMVSEIEPAADIIKNIATDAESLAVRMKEFFR
jgi:enoyl-[acyl-carrier protein] reductase II